MAATIRKYTDIIQMLHHHTADLMTLGENTNYIICALLCWKAAVAMSSY